MRILYHPDGDTGNPPATAAELKRELAELRAELQALKAAGANKGEIDALKKDLADARAKLEAAEAREKARIEKKDEPAAPRGWPW